MLVPVEAQETMVVVHNDLVLELLAQPLALRLQTLLEYVAHGDEPCARIRR